ncbi:hypothetical protein VZQ01_20425 [Myxococcus faecalis]|uniref:hypothetical protein n=1 Tax=Myxococcus TaxID=32 RepID=UPI001CC0DCB3|nr:MULTISPECIES: hypothetical protein [unclassified Myxococcus]MBZ4399005.1 hypothetical protein [Myxococcus sp. AS-1-15]MBZ4413398.1 hypothetical protein [Myxococcus sp. XM-1-1-1]
MAIATTFKPALQKLNRTEAKLEKLEGKLERVLEREHKLLKELRNAMKQQGQNGRAGGDSFDAGSSRGGVANRPLPNEWSPLDTGALRETNKLDKTKGPITADQLTEAIRRGTGDRDGNAARGEYRAFSEWAEKNQARLTPEAKQVMDRFSKFAAERQANGHKDGDWRDMMKDMKGIGDKGAEKQLAKLDSLPKPISGEQMSSAIERGVKDRDNNTGDELKAFQDWAKKNQDKLSPEAKEVLGKFEKHAKKAMASGDKDLSRGELDKMLKDFKSVGDVSAKKAMGELDKESGPISGEDMLGAIQKGVSDGGRATPKELAEVQKWAEKNKDRMTPEAQKVLETFQQHAMKSGTGGLDKAELDAAVKEASQHKTFRDDTMRTALEGLDGKSGKISGKDLTDAINQGAGDFDGQGAGVEHADFQKWAMQNYDRLSPEAKKVVDLYGKYASDALAKGETGIANTEFQKMLKEMERASTPVLPPRIIAA